MNIIVCVDDRMGLLFNKRRQSRDTKVVERIKELVAEEELWIHPFSKTLFPNARSSEQFLEDAKNGEYCFIENVQVSEEKVEKLYLFRWNRTYPFDVTLELPLDSFTLTATEEFAGSSHEKITLEIYVKGNK